MNNLEKLSLALEKKEIQQNKLKDQNAKKTDDAKYFNLARIEAFIEESNKLSQHFFDLLKKLGNHLKLETSHFSVGCGELHREHYSVIGMKISGYNKEIVIQPQDLNKGSHLGIAILNIKCHKDRLSGIQTSLILQKNNKDEYIWIIHEYSENLKTKPDKKLDDDSFYELLLDKLELQNS